MPHQRQYHVLPVVSVSTGCAVSAFGSTDAGSPVFSISLFSGEGLYRISGFGWSTVSILETSGASLISGSFGSTGADALNMGVTGFGTIIGGGTTPLLLGGGGIPGNTFLGGVLAPESASPLNERGIGL